MSAAAIARGAIALVALGLLAGEPASANDAAHKMAEKFAGANDGTKREPSRADDGKKSEADKKTEAEAKAAEARRKKEAERKAAEAKKRAAEDARRKEAKRKAEAQRKAAAEEAKRRAVEERRAEEAEMLARARREADEMRSAEEQRRLAEEARRLIEEVGKERAKAEALLAEQAEQTRAKEIEEAQIAQRRLEETKALAEKLRRVRQNREARLAAQAQREKEAEPHSKAAVAAPPAPQVADAEKPEAPERSDAPASTAPAAVAMPPAQSKEPPAPVVAGATPPPASPPTPRPEVAAAPQAAPSGAAAPAPPPVPAPAEETAARLPPPVPAAVEPAKAVARATETRVTVLLVLEPGTYGIRRRGPKTADPLLCAPPEGCYVSAGADRPAVFLYGRKALGFGNTMGNRAGACRNSLGCVFRNVELATLPGYLQPVDLHILKHDQRRPQAILGDSECRSDAGRLTCTRGIHAEDYVMWIVPESLADAVGPAVLEQAVQDGLSGPRSAELTPRR